MLDNPRKYLTKTELIENAWPENIYRQGVSDSALYQQIRSLRKKFRRVAPSGLHYIKNWRGVPEGGYRLFPTGHLQCHAHDDMD